MNIEAMKAFVRVADCKSVTKAAVILVLPQQTVSSMLSALENELNIDLFQHDKKNRILTEEGTIFYMYCIQFLRELSQLEKALHPERIREKTRTLRIGAQNSLAESLLPYWMNIAIKEMPELDFTVSIDSAVSIIEKVEKGLLDFGLIAQFECGNDVYPPFSDGVTFKPLISSKPYFWINTMNPLAAYKSIRIKMLEGQVLAQESMNDHQMMEYILKKYFCIDVHLRHVSNTPILIELVKNNLAITTDIITKTGELRMAQAFKDISNVVPIPLHKKDQYEICVGCVALDTTLRNSDFREVLSYFE